MSHNVSVEQMVSLVGRQALIIDQLTAEGEQVSAVNKELVTRLDAAVRILSCVALGVIKPCQIETDLLAKTWRILPVPEHKTQAPADPNGTRGPDTYFASDGIHDE